MKAITTLFLMFTALPAFAGEVTCYNSSNSDYELRLIFDGSELKQVALSNLDWSLAGKGDLQPVAFVSENNYVVTSDAESAIAIQKGATVQLNYNDSKLLVDVAGEYGHPNGESFYCL